MSPMQIRRTATPNAAPTGLAEGQLSVEMASVPPKLWVGVPTGINSTGRVLLGGNQVSEAPIDGYTYGRVNSLWAQMAAGRWVPLGGAQPNYTATLTPPLTTYTNGLAVTVIPAATNSGPVTINLGPGAVSVLRNDGQHLQFEDWDANIPQSVFYYNGSFYASGLLKSQVPIVRIGDVDVWIRGSDGNDANDGGDNTAARAFRSIQGAWNATVGRFSGSPGLQVVFRIGQGGSGLGTANLIGFPGRVEIRGPATLNTSAGRAITLDRMGDVLLTDITFQNNLSTWAAVLNILSSSNVVINNCTFRTSTSNPGVFVWAGPRVSLRTQGTTFFDHQAANRTFYSAIYLLNANYTGHPSGSYLVFNHGNYTMGWIAVQNLSSANMGAHQPIGLYQQNIGPQFLVNSLSIFGANGLGQPGTITGYVWNSSIFNP